MDEKLKFREALNELVARATADGGRISREELEKRVQEFGFTEEQLDMVGRYLKAMNIEIDGMEAVGGEAFAGSNEENRTDREPADLAGGNDGGEDADMTRWKPCRKRIARCWGIIWNLWKIWPGTQRWQSTCG